jgi:hypothetical protein
VKLSINSEATLKNASGEKIGTANKMVEIAELSEGDIVGLVEAFDGKKTMERSIHAIGAGKTGRAPPLHTTLTLKFN